MWFVDLISGLIRLVIIFLIGLCELVDIVLSYVVKEIFLFLGIDNDVEFILKIVEIGINFVVSL